MYEDFSTDCDGITGDCKVNQNTIPKFHFPSSMSNEIQTAPMSDVITTVSNKLTTIWNDVFETSTSVTENLSLATTTTTTENVKDATTWNDIIETSTSVIKNIGVSTTSTTENIISATIREVIPLDSFTTDGEKVVTNNIGIIGITKTVSNSSIIEMMQNGTISLSTVNNTDTIGIMENVSNSSITEIMQNGTISLGAIENTTHLLEMQTVTASMSSVAENLSSLAPTTEKMVVTINETIHNAWNTMKQKEDTESRLNSYHLHDHDHSHSWLYILLGLIAGILVVIGFILLLIYIRYRKHSLLPTHNYYEISPMKESCSPLPSHMQHEQEKQCTNEVYSQYST